MFTLLDGLNRFLSYFNLKLKVKNQLYIVLGAITTGYICYLTWKFFHYDAYARGFIYLAISLILLYFLILNIFYYVFDKNVKWDITPYFEKFAQAEMTTEMNNDKQKKKSGQYEDKMVIYDEMTQNLDDYQAFDVTLNYSPSSQQTIEELVDFMIRNGLAETNQTTAKKKLGKHKNTIEKKYELESGVLVPSYTIEASEEQLLLSIGLNATEREPVAVIEEIGGVEANKMRETYDIIATSAKIVGGKYREYGPTTVKNGKEPYSIQVKVACLVKLTI